MSQTLAKNLSLIVVLLFLSFFIFIADRLGLLFWPKYGLVFVINPIQYNLNLVVSRVSQEMTFLIGLRQIVFDYQKLTDRYTKLVGENAQLKSKLTEYEILKRQFLISPNKTEQLIPAQVLGVSRYLILNKGIKDNIQKGQIVILENNLVGKIVSVSPARSKVLIPTDSEFSTTVAIGENQVKGVLKGAFGSTMVIEKILPEEKVELGDLVISLGEGVEEEFIPKGLIIGKISEVEKVESALFKKATVVPIFAYSQLKTVFISEQNI